MERAEFLNKMGLGAMFALTATCLGSCSKNATTPSGPVDFSINLNDAANLALGTTGGYVIQNGVVIANTGNASYAAATVICSHEGERQIVYRSSGSQWYCSAHGATFDINGKGLNSNGSKGLTIYKTSVTGTSLRIYS
jgi:cytochrome b6-f complex iron-sulfur subunit